MDFSTRRISNCWIMFGLIAGIICCILKDGISGAGLGLLRMCIPLLLTGLFWLGALGAGDIKFLMVVALFVQREDLLKIMLSGLFLAGIGAFYKLIKTRGFRKRFGYFRSYILQVAATGKILTYKKRTWEDQEIIHFSLYIFLAVIIVLGGVV